MRATTPKLILPAVLVLTTFSIATLSCQDPIAYCEDIPDSSECEADDSCRWTGDGCVVICETIEREQPCSQTPLCMWNPNEKTCEVGEISV